MPLCCLSLVLPLAGGHRQAVSYQRAGTWGTGSHQLLAQKRAQQAEHLSCRDRLCAHYQGKGPRDDARHKTCTALCLEARLRRHARGHRAHAVQPLPALLRLRVTSTFPGLSQHKTHLGRILFPPRVITGPAKSHLLFAVTGLTALLLLQFDRNRGLFTRFDGRGGVFPIYTQGKEALGAATKDWHPPPKSEDTVLSPQAGHHRLQQALTCRSQRAEHTILGEVQQAGADDGPQVPDGAVVAQAVKAQQPVLLAEQHLGDVRGDGAGGARGVGRADGGAQRGVEGTADLGGRVRALVAGRGGRLGVRDHGHGGAPAARLDGQGDGKVLLRFLQLLSQDVDGVGLQDGELAICGPCHVLLLHLPFPLVPAQKHSREGE